MSIQEKAKELVNLFYQPLGTLKCGVSSDEMWEYGKNSALILVDKLIKNCPYISRKVPKTDHYLCADDSEFVEYWEEIKTEITNL